MLFAEVPAAHCSSIADADVVEAEEAMFDETVSIAHLSCCWIQSIVCSQVGDFEEKADAV